MWVDGMEAFRWHPYRGAVRLRFYSRDCCNRRYRCAQPPATSFDAFGIRGHSVSFPEVSLRSTTGISCLNLGAMYTVALLLLMEIIEI